MLCVGFEFWADRTDVFSRILRRAASQRFFGRGALLAIGLSRHCGDRRRNSLRRQHPNSSRLVQHAAPTRAVPMFGFGYLALLPLALATSHGGLALVGAEVNARLRGWSYSEETRSFWALAHFATTALAIAIGLGYGSAGRCNCRRRRLLPAANSPAFPTRHFATARTRWCREPR